MIRHFLEYIAIEKKYSEKTVQAYGDDLRNFCLFLGWESNEFNPTKVTEADIQGWMIHMMDEEHQSPRSVRRRLSSLRSFYKYMLKVGIVAKDVTRMIISPKMDKPLPVFFKPSEMERATQMEDIADDWIALRDNLIIQMLYQTGMRRTEMLGLTMQDVHLLAAEIKVFGKRKKERIIPIGEHLIEQIQTYLEARGEDGIGTLFVQENRAGERRPMTSGTLYEIVRTRMGEVSTLKKHSPHVLRHTFATTMLNNGADIRTIQQLLGHASLAATQIYTHATFEQVQQMYNAAHPRANKRKE